MKKLLLNLLALILILQLALPVVNVNKLSAVALGATDADTGGMQYANWYFGQNNLKEVNVVIEINNIPSTEDGLYFQAYDGYINGQMFYFGLQTRTGKPGYGLAGKGLIFSEFGTTDNTNIKTALGGWYEVGTYEGPFISTRVGYDWTNHKYILTIKYKESDTVGDWYEFWIEDLTTNSKTFAGALRFPFPKDLSKKGVTDGGGSWTELYYRKVQGTPLPEWSVSILEVSAVSKDGGIIYPKTAHLKNADNFYHIDQAFHAENNRLDFVIGGSTTKSFNEKDIILSSGTINVNATLNGNAWNGALNFTLTREKTYSYTTVPVVLTDYPIGTYTIQYDSSGPTNATLSSITPSSIQTLTSGNTVTFTMNFTTQKLNLLYIIVVANPSLKDTVQDFVKFKESQGFDVIVEDVPTIEQNYQGIDRVEKIRNFLKDKTKDYTKSFTLFIGEPYQKDNASTISTGGEVPMRYIDIWQTEEATKEGLNSHFPTDFYYADLEGNWDTNGDGVYGTRNDIIIVEVKNFVGRIPFSEPAAVKKMLENTIEAESKIETSPFDYKFLFAMIKFAGKDGFDSAKNADWDIKNTLNPAGFSQITTLYEKESVFPSIYSCTAPLNEDNFNKYLYGTDILVTHGHGGVAREVWFDTNKDGIVQDGEVKTVSFFVLRDLLNTQSNILLWIDDGCENIKSALGEQHYNSPDWPKWQEGRTIWYWNDDNWVSADDALRAGVVNVAIGSTAISSYGVDASVLTSLISYHRTIGEWLDFSIKEKYAAVNSDSYLLTNWKEYYLRFNILGDPSFGLFDDSLTISADVTPPTVQVASPNDNSFTNTPTITVSGTVSDVGSGVKSVEVNSNPVTLTNNSFNTTIQLQEGKNTITIIAIDEAGNETTTTLNIICDTKAPAILIGSPNDNSTVNTETISVSGSAIDENIDTVTINDQVVNFDSNNGFFDTTIKLQEGENVITISAVDKAGNRNTETIAVYYKKQKIIVLQIGQTSFTVNNISNTLDSPPVIKNNRTLLPIRAIIEALGGTVGWDPNEKKVTVTLGSTTIELWIGKSIAKVNGVNTPIDSTNPKVVPEIINSRTMLPLRFVAENLGCDVQWEQSTQTITIIYTGG